MFVNLWKMSTELYPNIPTVSDRISHLGLVKYSRTSMAQTSTEPWELVRDMSSSIHWGLIMAPGQVTSDNLEILFDLLYNNECTHKNRMDSFE